MVTYGSAVPAGLFLPGILIGCSLGRIVGHFIEFRFIRDIRPTTYAIVGSASILAGYTRLSFSLAVIMLETTENVSLFLPIISALFISFGIGRLFNRSLYESSVKAKNIPFLVEEVPDCNRHLTASKLMSSPVKSFTLKPTVKQVFDTIVSNDFNGYPVVNEDNRLIGLISKHFLVVLLNKRCWRRYDTVANEGDYMSGRSSLGTRSNVSQERIISSDESRNKSSSPMKIDTDEEK